MVCEIVHMGSFMCVDCVMHDRGTIRSYIRMRVHLRVDTPFKMGEVLSKNYYKEISCYIINSYLILSWKMKINKSVSLTLSGNIL